MLNRQNSTARSSQRMRLEAEGTCRTGRGFEWEIKFDDISTGGCRADDPRHGMELGSSVNLIIAGTGPHLAEVAWRQGDRVGLEFRSDLPESVVEHLARGEWEEAQVAAESEVRHFPIRRVI